MALDISDIPTILVIAGIIFLFVAIVKKIKIKGDVAAEVEKKDAKILGIVGVIFLAIGVIAPSTSVFTYGDTNGHVTITPNPTLTSTSLSSPTPTPTSTSTLPPYPDVKIINPTEGDIVPITIIINGNISGNLQENQYIWVVVNPHTSPDKWWPQSGRINPWNGKWNTQAQFGGENETSQKFDIAVILVDKQTDQYYQDYLKTGEQTGNFPGIPFPNNATILNKITVIRK